MHRLLITVTTATLLLGSVIASADTDCPQLREDPSDYSDATLHQKKVEYALALINDEQALRDQQECAAAAMKFLGRFHVRAAIPQLVRLLTYRRNIEHPIRLLLVTDKYPATAGLMEMGTITSPALLDAISKNEPGSLETKNAIEVIESLYRENPAEGLRAIRAAAASATFPASQRLTAAESEVRSWWCRTRPCSD